MIAFAGLSHLGIVHAIASAAKGFNVIAYHPDSALCAELSAGQLGVFEPGLQELFEASRERLFFTSDPKQISKCGLVFVSLDVATGDDNQSDLEPLQNLMAGAMPHTAPSATVVVLSQVPPGHTRGLLGGKTDIQLFYQVETLIFGDAVVRAMKPERFIIGCADPRSPLPQAYASWLAAFDCPILPMRYESAELAKISINCFLVSSVATTNTLAELCENIGADWSEIAPALRLDKRIGPHAYLSPGLGIAGGNLERDLVTVKKIADKHGTDARVVSAWQGNSRHRADWALRHVHREVLMKNPRPRLAIWGLAYKQDTHSLKNSPALALIESLAPFEKSAFDPMVKALPEAMPNLTLVSSALEACHGADALIVMTPWNEFRDIDPAAIRAQMRGDIIIDPFGLLDGNGFKYFKIGL